MPPSAFPRLPARLRAELQRRHCTIPQDYDTNPDGRHPHNVISGQFNKPGQTDWAVLCSVAGESSILVFWNGSEMQPAEIAKSPDSDQLLRQRFSRGIRAVGAEMIVGASLFAEAPSPPPIDHQGIDDWHLGCCSSVHYFYQGRWLRLPGGD